MHSTRSTWFLALTGALLMAAAGASAADLIHNPVLSAAAGQDIDVGAALTGAAGDPRVRLYWRPRGKEIFRSVEMSGPLSDLHGRIPGSGVDVVGVEYYLEASVIQAGKKTVLAQSPKSNPLLNPYAITVRKDQSGPDMTALSPGEGEVVDTARPVINVSFDDPDSGVDPGTVLIKLDGEVVKDRAGLQAFETLASWMPSSDLADGEHEVTVIVRDRSGNPGSVKWKFTVAASSGQKNAAGAKAWTWDGSLSARTEYAHALNQSSPATPLAYRPYGYNKADLSVNGRGPDDTVKLKVAKSDAERSDQQPSDRYTASWQNRQGILAVGDYTALNFSELSLYQLNQLRGVVLDLQSGKLNEGHTRLVGVWGQTRRAVENGASGLAGGTADATYAQYLYGARWEFGGPWFQMGLNSVTVNDDGASVTNPGSQQPHFNYVSSSDVRIGLPGGLKLSGEAGFDYYSDPVPVLDTSVGSAYKAGLDWNIKAWQSHLTFDWKDLGGNFQLLPGGYTSSANPGLLTDYRGYEGGFSQGLFDGQFNVDVNLNNWRDNLQGNKPATTTTSFFSVFTNISPNQWPYLVVGYTQNGQLNDADGNTGDVVANYIVDNRTSSLNLGLGYTRAFDQDRTGSLNVNWQHQAYSDLAAKRLGQDLAGDNVVLSLFGSLGPSSFNGSVGFGNTEQPGVAGSATALGADLQERSGQNFNASLRWNQVWKRSVFDSYLGYDLASNSSSSPAYGLMSKASSLSNRSTFSLGGNWTVATDQRIGLGLAFAVVGSENEVAGVKSTDELSQLQSSLSYDLTF